MTVYALKCLFRFSLVMATVLCFLQAAPAQKMDGIERDRMKSMLMNIKSAIKKDYYDPNFHGIDLDDRFKKAEDRLKEVATSPQALSVIAQVLIDFDDSHLYFIPPSTNWRVEYGYRTRMIGDKCFVIAVKPKSDAESKGLKVGDQILSLEGYAPTRKDMWKMNYFYNVLSKRARLTLSVLSPGDEKARDVVIESKAKKLPSTLTFENLFTLNDDYEETDNSKHLFQRIGGITIWRMPSFAFDPAESDLLMKDKVGSAQGLVIDLRSNGGGYVKTLEKLAGFFFDKDMKIADLKGRKPMDPITLKTRGKDVYRGKVVVLLSSQSGSGAEIFARLLQLENRGIVLGDVSAGAVMQARSLNGESGSGTFAIFYGASITNADVMMSDGKSIEHVGVTPDELILPTSTDLAKGRDPVLARAVELLGGQLSAEQAGKFFQYDWSGN